VRADSTIWHDTSQQHHQRFRPREFWLADLGYVGCIGLITKYKRRRKNPVTGRLPRASQYYNNVHEHVRNRVENVVGQVKAHKIFKQTFTRKFETLEAALAVVGHVTALQLRRYRRFRGYGPWSHRHG